MLPSLGALCCNKFPTKENALRSTAMRVFLVTRLGQAFARAGGEVRSTHDIRGAADQEGPHPRCRLALGVIPPRLTVHVRGQICMVKLGMALSNQGAEHSMDQSRNRQRSGLGIGFR